MEFSRQEYWSGVLFPSPRDLPDSRIECWSPALQADALPSEPPLEGINLNGDSDTSGAGLWSLTIEMLFPGKIL